ncbi:MAG: MMPL family transporter [Acuticoccus sp.]
MLNRIVAASIRKPVAVVVAALLLTAASAYYAATHFAITTDTEQLISADVPYRQDEIAFAAAFPQTQGLAVAVIEAETAGAADDAAGRLVDALKARPDTFSNVRRATPSDFLMRNALLFLPLEDVRATTDQLAAGAPLINALARDPSLRGLGDTLSGMMRAAREPGTFSGSDGFFGALSQTLGAARDGPAAPLDWRAVLGGDADGQAVEGAQEGLMQLVLVRPKLDFAELEPGAAALATLREVAADAGLDAQNGVRLRLTGPVPLADEEFATLKENALLNSALTILAVAIILFVALRSGRLIGAVLGTLFCGLIITSALGLLMVGQLNMISVAFAVLFIGLGVDFGIQLSTRYRAERHATGELQPAIRRAAAGVGFSLTLAALSLVAGFFSFLPTAFRGVSELGLIAGLGMVVAYTLSITFLPALMTLVRLKAEPRPVETASLAHVDHFIARHRRAVIALTVLVTLAGLPFLITVEFDSNPMNLRSQKVESVSTFLDLSRNPDTAPNTLQVLVPALADIAPMKARLEALPEVGRAVSVASFMPDGQAAKLALIGAARQALHDALTASAAPEPASAQETTAALSRAAATLSGAAQFLPGGAETLGPLGTQLQGLADAPADVRERATTAVFGGLPAFLEDLRAMLSPNEELTAETLPPEIAADWIAADGRARIEVSPVGDANDNAVLQRFADAVRTVAPNASGPPIGITEAGTLIVRAFLEAGIFALVAITAILWIALRRLTDVVLALGPLVLAGIWTLEFASLIGLPLNFANVIALPLMFGVGIAFHVYYLIAWRNGVADVLASSLTRAIFFSALTTGTAFGSLWASSHPGTSSMGELLAISLVFTLIGAFLVVPAFLGPPHAPAASGSHARR